MPPDSRFRPSLRSVRFRLTALYSGLFLTAGAVLLAVTYLLVDRSTPLGVLLGGTSKAKDFADRSPLMLSTGLQAGRLTATQAQAVRRLTAQAAAQHANDLQQLLTQSGVALAIMAGLAIVSGWLMAGRALRPLRIMTEATRQITERNLHERLALPGPRDEVKDLADTIDTLLARMEKAFDAQRRFVANASHELRTPLTFDRALLEVALADPGASAAELRATCQELLASAEQQARLIGALLTLASSERGLDRHERFDLAAVAERAVSAHRTSAARRGVELRLSLGEAGVAGNPDLAERMAANLVDNAIRYNVPEGHLDVRTETIKGHSVLTVANTGPEVPRDQLDRLTRPFQRLGTDRSAHPDGHGLGLSIVHAIAAAHDGDLSIRIRRGGGLIVEACLPCAPIRSDDDKLVPLAGPPLVRRPGYRRRDDGQRTGRR